ncbi:hypothetical protein ABG79_01746 [Caloramator mitchellensis]|uniref:DUF401 family protein n=1 Tax=Caloramator mitchellensis TaxID=908809 RepID=A0A0R3JSQ7_CALMK|nr:DUF401 family protein [Caloramator mitchellensis]KRQ86537.1 hypothetical protein ABG79_01746 [Caloramator mitchellensis]
MTYFAIILIILLNIYLFKKNINVGIIMLINALFIAVLTKMPVNLIYKSIYVGAFSEKTIDLLFSLVAIMIIENMMRTSGMISKMVESLKILINNKLFSAIALPATLGLLPSPGGARFSCPMVEEVTGDEISGLNKAYINYWFRHMWLDGFVLYPGVILAAKLIDVSVISLFFHLIVFIIIYALVGVFMVREKMTSHVEHSKSEKKIAIIEFLIGIFPVAFMIITYIALLNYTKYALNISAIMTILILVLYKRISMERFKEVLKEAFNGKYIVIILGVMIFKEFLTNSGLVAEFSKAVTEYNIPKEVLFVIIPLISNFFFGVTVTFVSLTFPILISFGVDQNIWYAVAAFVSGFIGGMITPVHLCSVMTAEYFGIKVDKLLIKIAASAAFVLAGVIGLLIIL